MASNSFIVKPLPLHLETGLTLESLISQIQPQIFDIILAVKDGVELVVIKTEKDIPKALFREGETKGEMYNFRCLENDSLYTFFGPDAASLVLPSSYRPVKTLASLNMNGVISIATSNNNKIAKIQLKKMIFDKK